MYIILLNNVYFYKHIIGSNSLNSKKSKQNIIIDEIILHIMNTITYILRFYNSSIIIFYNPSNIC